MNDEMSIDKYFKRENWWVGSYKKEDKPFYEWFDNFKNSSDYPQFVDALRRPISKCHDDGCRALLIEQVSRACFNASQYSLEKDINRNTNLEYKEADMFRLRSIKALDTLLELEGHKELILNVVTAIANIESKGIKFDIENKDMNGHQVFQTIFKEFRDTLSWGLPGYKSGPFTHRFKVGPLVYSEPRDFKKAPSIQSMLAFHLTMIFRVRTKGAHYAMAYGMKMPNFGSPCLDTTAKIVSIFTNSSWTEDDVNKSISKLVKQQVGLGDWDLEQ